MSNSLAVRTPIEAQIAQAEWFARSGFMPKHLDSAAKIYAVVTLGQELGLGPWAAINNIYLAGGKPTINASLMLALVQGSGALEHFDAQVTETEATVTMTRRGVGSYTSRFSLDAAAAAGLTTGYNGQTWKKYPRAMLKARAISDCARTLFADVLLGMYTPEELGAQVAVETDGSVVVVPPTPLTGEEARRLFHKWHRSHALTADDLKAALGGPSSAWVGGFAAADARVGEWLAAQIPSAVEGDAPDGDADEDVDAETAQAFEDAIARDAD